MKAPGSRSALLPCAAVACLATVLFPAGASGVTTRSTPFQRPPYFRGDVPPAGARTVLLPVVVTLPEDLPGAWFPVEALQALAADVEDYLGETIPTSLPPDAGRDGRPTVAFGCSVDEIGECDGDARQNELIVSGGTGAWRGATAAALREVEADHAVQVEVSLAPRWIHQKNLSGKKEVRLGTDRTQALPWLTALDSPVWVLQLTGAIVDGEGKVVRSGAEGLWAVRTPFRASMLGAERLMTAEEVERIRTTARRDDLPGSPLVWEAAAQRLVHGLTHGSEPM